ncbi:MAG TPA: alpha-galactosidase [Chthoniobacteraceae bacterium]|nr:alpha-galactosidase [Chthoniobacteraceae bacterium]
MTAPSAAAARSLSLENAFITRKLSWEPGIGLRTVSLRHHATGTEYVREEPACEFLVEINGKTLFGYKEERVHIVDGERQRSGFAVEWEGVEEAAGTLKIHLRLPEIDARLSVCHELLEGEAAMTKWLEITAGTVPLTLGKCFFEVLNAAPGPMAEMECFTRSGLTRAERMFVTHGFDDILQMHHTGRAEGCFVANEAPGPLNRFLFYPQWTDTTLSIGYNCDTAPFRKYLEPGERFVSHRSLLMLYRGERDAAAVRNRFRACLRQRLPPPACDELMYCTWIPFTKNIDEALLLDLAERAAALKASTFVIDDGWFVSGGWKVDEAKFPRGLEPVAEKVRSLGMRLGLWFNIGTDYGIEGEHPEEDAIDDTGRKKTNGFVPRNHVKCLASAHRERLLEKLTELATRYGVGYFKLDFSSIISPYGLLRIGCHSREHRHHRDGSDALLEQYAALDFLRDGLRSRFPDLILDFSFESFGTDWPNLAALQSSRLHHSSNLNTKDPELCSALDIRNTLYRFNTVLPIERIMGSLICLEGDQVVENLLTAWTGAPLVAGDLRRLPQEVGQRIATLVEKMSELHRAGPLHEFEKLRGDQPVRRGQWDGFARWNASGHGILCLFRNGSAETPLIRLDLPRTGCVELHEMESGERLLSTSAEALREGVELPWAQGRGYRCLSFR